ncbi:MAG: SdpI family protein [Actinomycetota bacterium]|nr:SdpI family protein [Actinomycetota bacterium]
MVVVGVLGWRRLLPRNRVVGVRTAATLRDDETFAVGNQVGAPLGIAAGVVAALGGTAAIGAPSVAAAWVLAGVSGIGVVGFALLGGVLGDRAASRVPLPSPGGCTGVCTGCTMVEGCTAGSQCRS